MSSNTDPDPYLFALWDAYALTLANVNSHRHVYAYQNPYPNAFGDTNPYRYVHSYDRANPNFHAYHSTIADAYIYVHHHTHCNDETSAFLVASCDKTWLTVHLAL